MPIKLGLAVEATVISRRLPSCFAESDTISIPAYPSTSSRRSGSRGVAWCTSLVRLERAVELAALKARPRGGVFVLLDRDDDCPAELAPPLLARAESAGMGLPVYVILPQREFEGWFLAAAESIRGKRGLPADLAPPPNPEEIRGAKGWLRERMRGHVYAETIDQPALAAIFDLKQARAAKSFDKCYRDLRLLIEWFRA